MLAGAVMYLLEWVAIIPAGDSGPADPSLAASKVPALYTSHPTAVAFLTTWVSVVLLGRVLLVLGIRSALRSVGADTTLVTFGAAAMTLSVAMEVVSEAAVGAGTAVAAHSGSPELLRALDTLAGFTWNMVFGPLGVAVAVTAWAMLRSRAFPVWMPAVGMLGGVLLVVAGIASGPGYLHDGFARGLTSVGGVGVPLFWIWMLATGIFLLRRVTSDAKA